MALLFIDSFDHYVTADITEKWTAIYGTVAIGAYGRRSGNGVRLTCGGNIATGAGLFIGHASMASGVAGWAMYVSALPGTTVEIAGTFEGGGNSVQWQLALNSDGSLSVYRAGSSEYPEVLGTILGTSAGGVIQAGVWAYVECSWTISDAAGAVTVRVDEVPVLELSGIDNKLTATAASTSWFFAAIAVLAGYVIDIDDFYLCDTTGGVNDDFLGDVRIDPHYPTGAGATTAWTASAGNNYACVDETSPNDDTDYVSTSTTDAVDTYVFEDLKNAGATIKGLQVVASMKKTDAGACSVAPVVRRSGTYYLGTGDPAGTTYAYHLRQPYDTDPATGSPASAWTEATFNAAEFGVKKTA